MPSDIFLLVYWKLFGLKFDDCLASVDCLMLLRVLIRVKDLTAFLAREVFRSTNFLKRIGIDLGGIPNLAFNTSVGIA